ncbi:glycosyltransferase family 2 protein [Demequina zhanjiangensis]|uniref:Glycosyltransferase family 2 protein n=1 Tax=Demequina zhanjiangensis TaxID=3051659 RepID=A0ABT8FYR6_9MICO|nr:glycosyltransferase family 2 protein [Demequina sp. SYSU T00b26]MDN4472041.1 glycosyltransferase family 2 protein [Demequina sp. SYSU T00b26]
MTRTPFAASEVLVTVCTYKRPEGLAAFLDSYAADATTSDATLLVVDNSTDGDAQAQVEAFAASHEREVRYAHEPRPGIAAARNRCLAEWGETHAALVFVDDDEEVPQGWLGALVGAAHGYDADIVNGHVLTVYPEPRPGWVERSGLFQRRLFPEGSSEGIPATNNTLLRREAWVEAGEPTFSESFSRTGGSDTDFFHRLIDGHGCRFVWSAEAAVTEPLPRSRMSVRWAWKRHMRAGNVLGRVMLQDRSRPVVLAGGVARVGQALAMGVVSAVTFREPVRWFVGRTARGLGVAGSALSQVVVEYERGGEVEPSR